VHAPQVRALRCSLVRVGLVQISIGLAWSQPGSEDASVEYDLLPYSVGLLVAHARVRCREEHEFVLPVFSRLRVSEAADRLEGCDVVALSLYVWNVNLSLAIAAEVKRRHPEVVIVVGGPQVPDDAGEFMRSNPHVDVACHGEGEITFTELLDELPGGDLGRVRSITFRDRQGRTVATGRRDRVEDLDTLPSPYLDGTFDELLAQRPGQWVMTWETNRGCPFSCTFCDWGSATAAKVYRFGMDRLSSEIEWMARHRVGFVFCCDANFGMLPRDLEIAEAVVASKRATGFPWSLSVQNTKNARERAYKVQTLIAGELNTLGVTISLQSANRETLVNIKRRNISSEAYEDLQQRFARDGVYTYTDLILGLPGDSYETFTESVSHVVANGQHNHVQFHNCSILPNAEMADSAYREQFGIESIPQQIVSAWDRVDRVDEVPEYLETVVSTAAMNGASWERAKVFAWFVDLAYFERLLQVPISALSARHGLRLAGVVEAFIAADPDVHPVIAAVVDEMRRHAASIRGGGVEYRSSVRFGSVHMPADHFALATLVADGRLRDFFKESESVLSGYLASLGISESPLLVGDLLDYNEALFVAPRPAGRPLLVLSHPIADLYRRVLEGDEVEVEERWAMYSIDRSSRPVESLEDFIGHLAWCHGKDKRNHLAVASPARIVRPIAS